MQKLSEKSEKLRKIYFSDLERLGISNNEFNLLFSKYPNNVDLAIINGHRLAATASTRNDLNL